MAILLNNTAHAIIIGGKLFIPRRPVDNVDVEKLKTTYPEVAAMMKAGQLIEKTPEESKALKAEYEQMEADDLKAYAKSKGINIGRANKKESILEAIRKAESERLTAKG